jgi:hypothetical protein
MIQPSTDGHSVKRLNYATEVNHDKTSKTQNGERSATRKAMKEAVFECVEADCKRTRRHSANGWIIPVLRGICGVIRLD